MAYRTSAKPREPKSPDIDENLLRRPWFSHALIVSVVYSPLLAWWVVMVKGGNGPREVSLEAKIAIVVVFTLWLVALLILRARHRRVLKAAVARMEQEAQEEASVPVRVADEPSRTRVGEDEHEDNRAHLEQRERREQR